MNEIQAKLKDGILNYNRKNYDEAIVLFNDIINIDPLNPEANYYLGLKFAKDNNFPKAVLHLKNVVDSKVNFIFTFQCRMILGYIYYVTGEYERALNEFLLVQKGNIDMLQVHSALASVYYKLEKYDKAIEEAKLAYDLDNYNINAKNTYGFLLCDLEIDIDKGLEILKEVVRMKPSHAPYLDSLAWAYYKKGDIKSSIAIFKEALKISNNSEILEHYDIVVGRKKINDKKTNKMEMVRK